MPRGQAFPHQRLWSNEWRPKLHLCSVFSCWTILLTLGMVLVLVRKRQPASASAPAWSKRGSWGCWTADKDQSRSLYSGRSISHMFSGSLCASFVIAWQRH
ncbi:hypothetical protein J3E68DRAFT_288469 [Trichoderma sp. SZMC 28012]